MTDNKKNSPKKNGPVLVALNKLQQHPITLGVLVLIICCFVLLTFTIQHYMIDNARLALANDSAKSYAQQQLTLTNTYLQTQQQQLQNIAEKDLFIDALTTGDTEGIHRLEGLMKEWVEGLSHGYLLSPQDTRLYKAHNFVGQTMSQKVLDGKQPDPVAAYIDSTWQLIFAYPLKTEGGVILGTMVAMLPTGTLADSLLAKVNRSLGTTKLTQTLPDIPSTSVIKLNNKTEALDGITLKTKIPHWQIRFTGSALLLEQAQPSYQVFVIIVAGLIIIMLLLIYVVIRYTLHHHKDKPKKRRSKNLVQNDAQDDPQESTPVKKHAYIVGDNSDSFLQVIPSAASESGTETTEAEDTKTTGKPAFPDVVFRDYDIRGLANTQLTPEFAEQLGKVLAKKALSLGEHSLIVGCDGRKSSPALTAALEQGILSTGCNIIYLGQVPTPLLNFATRKIQETDCGIMVTASHNPAEYNGFKIFFKHHALCGDEIQALKAEMECDIPAKTDGQREMRLLSADYVNDIVSDIVPAQNLKVVLDGSNGVAGELGVTLLEAIGCKVMPLHCDIDGDFPNHPPDTSVAANLEDLILCVKEHNADLGIALDGDGDRVVAVSASGKIIWPDELLMIFARDVISRQPGADVVFDIKSTRRLNNLISSYGGRPIMWKTGHSHMYNKMLECDAPLGGEYSGHIFFRDRWHGFDDGLYAAARLIEIMSIREQGLDEIVSSFETLYATTEIKIDVTDEEKFVIVESLVSNHAFQDGKVSTIDGLRVDFPKAWGLIRASNTSPALTLRFEAESEEALEKIQSLFRQQLRSIDTNLTF
ncbi:MAG TPA: phosphomannomutase/phosphoglucomutase [Porticoccus sp.]|nr:phosphomannomutase/phosphoglucomutase [Porticoccus sp.]